MGRKGRWDALGSGTSWLTSLNFAHWAGWAADPPRVSPKGKTPLHGGRHRSLRADRSAHGSWAEVLCWSHCPGPVRTTGPSLELCGVDASLTDRHQGQQELGVAASRSSEPRKAALWWMASECMCLRQTSLEKLPTFLPMLPRAKV